MKTIKDKQILVGADFAGAPLKNAVVKHLKHHGWTVTDIGVKTSEDENPEMFHRIGFKVGAKIAEGEFERALLFCGTGMGIHIAASQCPHVQCAVVESIPAALRCVTGNGCNILSMGAFYVAPETGKAIADAFLNNNLGDGYEDWKGFYEFHKLAYDEIDQFDYEAFKKNGFEPIKLGEAPMDPIPE
ncbi:MAG TPA: RpiB/LacA/LacB family sugar-phosphate isomerase [Clostridiales bacterium]|nr:RpiB/LacA/LacB family sugar-phosphate isomerase [Clostridiales bacterium]